MDYKKIAPSLVVGIAIGAVLGYAVLGSSIGPIGGGKDQVANEVLEVYELANPGSNLNVMGVEEVGGLYRIMIETGQQTHETVYATRDGEFITQTVTDLQQFRDQIQKRKEFMECLKEKNVTIFGALQINNTQIARATQLQLQILGGTQYLEGIYYDCSNNMQTCANAGIQRLPSVQYEGEFYSGVKEYNWFKENTGCSV